MKTIEATIDEVSDHLRSAQSALVAATANIRARDQELEDAELFQWLCANPDEAASAIDDAYNRWNGEDAKDWKRLLLDEIDHQRRPRTTPSPADVFSQALNRISNGNQAMTARLHEMDEYPETARRVR